MRVCLVSRRYWPAVSGMSVYAENLLRELVALGVDVVLVSQYREDEAGTRVYGGGPPVRVPEGVRSVGVPSRGEAVQPADFEGDTGALVERVRRLHAEQPFDVLHAQYGYPPGLAVLQAGAELGLPSVVSIQGGDGHWVGTCCSTHKAAITQVLDASTAVLIGSPSFRDEVVGHHGTDPARFRIVPGATDTVRFAPGAATFQPGRLQDPPVLLFHGRVDRRKGVLDLLDAVDLLRARGRRVRLVVSGIGPDLDEVRARSGDDTELTGYTDPDDAPGVYRSADVFVSPTYSEGFSNTILEAMASGLPVVSTDSVGVVDCLRSDENGLLHAPGDVEGLVAQLDRLLDDAPLRQRLALTALEEVRRLYSWPVLARAVADVYEQVRGTASPAVPALPPPDLACRFRAAPHLL